MKYAMMTVALFCCVAAVLVGCSKNTPADGGQKPSKVIVLDEENFDSQVEEGVVLVDFWAVWCGPCKVQGPIVEKVAQQVEGTARVGKLDVDAAAGIAQKYKIEFIPTLVIFKDGKPLKKFVGVTEAQKLVAAIQSANES